MRIAVLDGGCRGTAVDREGRDGLRVPADLRALARQWRSGGRRGHGLEVVGRIAAEHGGRFMVRPGPRGTVAALELPLAGPPVPAAVSAGAA